MQVKFIFAVLFVLFTVSVSPAQTDAKAFEGVIDYDISVKSKNTNGTMFKDFFAQKMTLRVKNNCIRCDYDSTGIDSIRLGYMLVLGDSNSVYRVMPNLKLMQRKNLSALHETEQVFTPETYRSLERKERVAGVMCSMFMTDINMPMGGGKARVIVSCADGLNFPVNGNLMEQSTILILGNGIRGIPLKKVIRFEEFDIEVTMTANRVSRETVADEWFVLPEKFRLEQFNRSSAN